MYLVDAQNAVEYLRRMAHVPSDAELEVRELPGGVSNCVLSVRFADNRRQPLVLKQARSQLRTPAPWFCGVERIWREIDVLKVCQRLAAPGQVPQILFAEWDNYLFGMTAAPADSRNWKQELLAGRIDPGVGTACGELLARLHAGTWHDRDVAKARYDREIFRQLRLDPYYRAVGAAFPEYADKFESLSDSVWQNGHALVHADFTPKNILVHAQGLTLLDFETGHYGDPAFDLGLFLAHLVLKAVARRPAHGRYLALCEAFWESYEPPVRDKAGDDAYAALVERAIRNFAGCVWARLDGTSRIEYLPFEPERNMLRSLAQFGLSARIRRWGDVVEAVERGIAILPVPEAPV